MKRQARPFVVETKRSRKAPTSLWASTPLLQQELAAAAPEPNAGAMFSDRIADKPGQRPAEPVRRILQSLVPEAPSPALEALASEEAEEAEAVRRRARSEDDEAAQVPARRGRPRRAMAAAEAEPEGTSIPATVTARSPARKPAAAKAPKAPREPEIRAAIVEPAEAPAPAAADEPEAAPSLRTGRTRAARSPAALALLPGERWKRRLPQRLW